MGNAELNGADSVPGPIFSQPWWLEAVAPGAWGEATVEKGGKLFARMPYVIRHHRGLRLMTMPPLTQNLGPWIAETPGKYATQLSHEHQMLVQLKEQLPSVDFFHQNFHHKITSWLPFYWDGYEQTTRYTYIIDSLQDLDSVWAGTRSNIRTDVRKAQQKVGVRSDLSLETFLKLNEMTFLRQGMSLPYERALVERLDEACRQRDCRLILFAEDGRDQLHAAAYFVWDRDAMYYLMSGADPELRNSGATSLLLWEAIQFASKVSRSFDFEGSMIQPVERFFRAFGARQVPYFEITKVHSLSLQIRRDVKRWLGRWRDG